MLVVSTVLSHVYRIYIRLKNEEVGCYAILGHLGRTFTKDGFVTSFH